MDIKRFQKQVDKALELLSDHDDKKDEKRYYNLRDKIQESQDYIDNGNYSHDISLELYHELKICMKEFEEDKFVFIIFLIILCGLLFIGVFYITYSHFHDHFHPHPGGHVKPSYPTRPTRPSSTTSITTSDIDDTTKTTKSTTTSKTSTVVSSKTTVTTKTAVVTTSVSSSVNTSKPTDEEEPIDGFVSLIFDNSSLVDLENLFPMSDSLGLQTKPTTWSLSSSLSNSSKDYVLTYYIDFVDKFGNVNDPDFIEINDRLDINKLKYQLLVKRSGIVIHDTGVQDMYDYPEAEEGIRPILSGQTMNNDETIDFELRMWLDSSVGNDQQGKKYRFDIDINYTFEFIE